MLLHECLGDESTSGLFQISVALRSGRAEEPGPLRSHTFFPVALAWSHPHGQPLKPITYSCLLQSWTGGNALLSLYSGAVGDVKRNFPMCF